MSMALNIYRSLSWSMSPLVGLYFSLRQQQGKEDAVRWKERWGYPSAPRDMSRPLIWVHAVSVGEAVSTLPLLKVLHEECPQAQLLLTTGTVTSAKLISGRLPPYVIHQFAPLDLPQVVTRFLEAWEPDLSIGVESELWPNTLYLSQERGIPMLLLNGKLSERSYRRWKRLPSLIRPILERMAFVGTQTTEDQTRFGRLGALHVDVMPNLKLLSDPLGYDEIALKALRKMINKRMPWCAAGTHGGEEDVILETHQRLKKMVPTLLTILIPRHPHRALEIRELIERHGLTCAQRSCHEKITPETDVYLADTLGEMGLFYKISSVAFVGATLVPKGGHNPLEAAQLGAYVIHGPYTSSNRLLYVFLKDAGCAEEILDDAQLSAALIKRGLGQHQEGMAEQLREERLKGMAALKTLVAPYLEPLRGHYAESA